MRQFKDNIYNDTDKRSLVRTRVFDLPAHMCNAIVWTPNDDSGHDHRVAIFSCYYCVNEVRCRAVNVAEGMVAPGSPRVVLAEPKWGCSCESRFNSSKAYSTVMNMGPGGSGACFKGAGAQDFKQ